jgi:acetyl esterase/lipase
MRLSWQLRVLLWQMRWIAKPLLRRTGEPEKARRDLERAAAWMRWPPYLYHVTRPGGLHRIKVGVCQPAKVILYFHGGGYVAGSPSTHVGMLGRLSKLSGYEVCAPEYPLAPETTAPAQFEAGIAAWDRLMALGYAPRDVVIGGDSAGGGLALAVLSAVLRRGDRPAGAFFFSPWTDLTCGGESLVSNRSADPILPSERIHELVGMIAPDLPKDDPRLSPLFADFPVCPPVLMHYAETEILRDDARRMAAHLRASGASVEEKVHSSAPHVWMFLDGYLPEARRSLREVAQFVQASFAETKR